MLKGMRFYIHLFFCFSFNKNFYKFTKMLHIFYLTFKAIRMHTDL